MTWREFLKSHWSVLAASDFFSVELLVKGKLIRCMVLFAVDLSTRQAEILDLRSQPNGPWMEQIARNVTDTGGFLAGKKYLIHDRDPLYGQVREHPQDRRCGVSATTAAKSESQCLCGAIRQVHIFHGHFDHNRLKSPALRPTEFLHPTCSLPVIAATVFRPRPFSGSGRRG